MSEPEPEYDFDQEIAKLKPLAVVLREDGQGMVEYSFAMGWMKDRANVFWSGTAYSILGEHKLDGPADARYNADKMGGRVWDPFDPECPVQVDLRGWMAAFKNSKRYKFDRRNARISPKPAPNEWEKELELV